MKIFKMAVLKRKIRVEYYRVFQNVEYMVFNSYAQSSSSQNKVKVIPVHDPQPQ